LRFSRW